MYREIISHSFLPARGNALLIGDAGCLCIPVSGEGIGTAIKSGLLAAESTIKATESGGQADRIYLAEVDVIISKFNDILPWFKKIIEELKIGGRSLPEVVRDSYSSTLRMF